MGQNRKPLPSVTLALILTLGERTTAFPVFQRDLLVDAAALALHDMVEDAQRETDPAASEAKKQEAIILSRILRRIIPELRELMSCIPVWKKEAVVQ